ncbi:DUF6318 family protein [Terrabacter sp. Soil810]|uniref:DUF6318 family protein n=1 Tax=Terrabacter sp. Soil810 TaxID=1736418 RepID=UPI000B2FDD96|nr:DUF6318 family protein [Terrabacter sp. Soil810]
MTAAARSHRHRTLLAFAATSVALATLGACTGSDPGPAVTTPASGSSSTSSVAPATTTTSSAPSPTTSGPDFPVGLPEAAKAHTAKGAEAFVRHYMAQWNLSWTTPDARLLPPLCDEAAAAACASVIKDAREYEAKGWKYDGVPGSISNVKALSLTAATQRVLAQIQQHKRHVIDSAGSVKESYPEKIIPLVFYLTWSRTGWELTDLRPVS